MESDTEMPILEYLSECAFFYMVLEMEDMRTKKHMKEKTNVKFSYLTMCYSEIWPNFK